MPYSGGGTSNPTINTTQTPDTYYLSTDPLGNSLIIGEAADAGFDFAHALATDPNLFIHSHNQSTTQWLGLVHNGTNAIVSTGTGGIYLTPTQSVLFASSSGSVGFRSDSPFGFASTADPASTLDAFLTREAAAIIQMGSDVNGAAIDQTLKSHDGITGSNIASANFILAPGVGTGTGTRGSLQTKFPLEKASGTTAQTFSTILNVPAVMFTATADGAVSNTTAETTILGTGVGTKTAEAGLWRAGRTFRIQVNGFITNTATPTLNIKVKAGSTILASTGVQTMTTITGTRAFVAEAVITCRTTGASGTAYTQGDFYYDTNVTGFAMEDMVSNATVTVDTTAAQALDVTATWGTASASNAITGTNVIIEVLN